MTAPAAFQDDPRHWHRQFALVPASEAMIRIGDVIRYAREQRHVPLMQVSDELKISLPTLQAIEDSHFHMLPAPVYARGYLRQYALYLGLDPEALVRRYDHDYPVRQKDEEPFEKPSYFRAIVWQTAFPASWIAALLIMLFGALLAVGFWPTQETKMEEVAQTTGKDEREAVRVAPSLSAGQKPVEVAASLPLDDEPAEVVVRALSRQWVRLEWPGGREEKLLEPQGEWILPVVAGRRLVTVRPRQVMVFVNGREIGRFLPDMPPSTQLDLDHLARLQAEVEKGPEFGVQGEEK